MVFGVLGVGSLASFVVTGLCDGVDGPPTVVLSPRNAETAARLAASYPTVTVADDNQAVLDAADLVLVLLRRQHCDLLQDLSWRPDHVVVSAVSGLPLAELAAMVAPAGEVARAVAMPANATRSFRTPIHPPVPAALALFERLGGTLPVADGEQFEAIYTSMGTFAPFFGYLTVISEFLVSHGLPAADAQQLLASTFVDVARPLSRPEPDFAEMVAEYAPPGGGNEQLTALMREEGVFDGMARALAEVHRRLSGTGSP
jgi:pyrroline-5-carboxylate reductase